MKDDIELKRCPFCGSHARILKSDDAFPRFIVRCGNSVCPERPTAEADSSEGAIALWNSRPIEDVLQKNNLDLMEKLNKTIEALKFYAAEENYYMHGTYGKTNVRDDNGKIAREVLNALHVD